MLRLEYDEVVAFHPYRTDQPWDVPGSTKILHVDGPNTPEQDRNAVARWVGEVEWRLLRACDAAKIPAHIDNHYGFTVRAKDRLLQVRFSDGSLYVWLMPGSV
jgi:hypothetical protein